MPEHFRTNTAASYKDFGLDYSHFRILAELIGAEGIAATPDQGFFEYVKIQTQVATGSKKPSS